ncbi:hypothetical protein BpHYR1_048282 [Brachionus plicatilis]|uniref:Uncharacterized protein n=1 Tax=Brachionus plicatilis TaxID=10195 RepID=A0A3M7QCB8_BRAPC|nr:hypothetical protein BpHYR1_048282 [Brachionus plicatilis]
MSYKVKVNSVLKNTLTDLRDTSVSMYKIYYSKNCTSFENKYFINDKNDQSFISKKLYTLGLSNPIDLPYIGILLQF